MPKTEMTKHSAGAMNELNERDCANPRPPHTPREKIIKKLSDIQGILLFKEYEYAAKKVGEAIEVLVGDVDD